MSSCASRVIAAARETGTLIEPAGGPDRVPQQGTGTAFGAEVQYLHAPSVSCRTRCARDGQVSMMRYSSQTCEARHGLRVLLAGHWLKETSTNRRRLPGVFCIW